MLWIKYLIIKGVLSWGKSLRCHGGGKAGALRVRSSSMQLNWAGLGFWEGEEKRKKV